MWDLISRFISKEVLISTIVGLVLWAGHELWRGTFTAPTPVGWDMIPPEAVARLILFVGPAILLGMWWNSRSVERERMRLETINAATNYIQHPTPERLTTLKGRLARLGLKGNIPSKGVVKLVEFLHHKDFSGARKFMAKTSVFCLTTWPLFGNLVCS